MEMEAFVNISNGTRSDCYTANDVHAVDVVLLIVLLVLALLILIILSFVQKRNKLCPNFLWGYPGIPLPMDFLVTPRYRTIYTIIFGVMAATLIRQFQARPSGTDGNLYSRTFYNLLLWPILLVLNSSLTYFPLFACVSSPRLLLGRILGLCYSIIWTVRFLVNALLPFLYCVTKNNPIPMILIYERLAVYAPVIIGAFIVSTWYLYKVVFGCLKLCGKVVTNEEVYDSLEVINTPLRQRKPVSTRAGKALYFHILHVKSLLKRPQVTLETSRRVKRILYQIRLYFFPYSKSHRLPLPFVGTVVAMSLLLYQLTITIVISAIGLTSTSPQAFNDHVAPYLRNISVYTNQTVVYNILIDVLGVTFVGLPRVVFSAWTLFMRIMRGRGIILVISPVVSFLLCLFLLIHMVGSVSKQLKEVAKNGFTERLMSPASRVPSSWKYVGYQVGFFFLAYGIYTALVFVAGVICAVIYIGFKHFPDYTIQVILYILIPVVWSQLIFFSESLICRFIFFEDGKGKFIAITNRRLFNWFSYVLFFYNGFAGFVNAILRTIMSSLFALTLIFRLDRVILMKGFERFDFGHKAYLGFIYLNYIYNNAIVHVFINLLRGSTVQSLRTVSESKENLLLVYSTVHTRQAHNRWLVAYTLLRNPSIQSLTASRIQEAKAVHDVRVDKVEVIVPNTDGRACASTLQVADYSSIQNIKSQKSDLNIIL